MNASAQLVEAPASDANYRYETLGYVDAYDAVLNCDYAFVAYREIESSGDWRVRIKSSQTAGAVFEPAAMRSKARETGAQGRTWFQWGYSFAPVRAMRATFSSAFMWRTDSRWKSKCWFSSASSMALRMPRNR